MSNIEDIQKAKDHINNFIKLGQQIQLASPYLNFMTQNLDWYITAYNVLPQGQSEAVMKTLDATLATIQSLDYMNFEFTGVTGSTAVLLTSTQDATLAIKDTPSQYHYLIDNFHEINVTDKLIENILEKLSSLDTNLHSEFNEVKNSYQQWKIKFKTNSDLSKDTRTFQEHFEGLLNKLRVPKNEWGKTKIPAISWNKIVESICKKDPNYKKSFLQQQKVSEDIWKTLTPVLKKTQTVTENEMNILFKRYIDHVFSVLNLIDTRFF